MEDDYLLGHDTNARVRWIGIVMGVALSFAALHDIWSDGLRNWHWIQNGAFAMLGFSLAVGSERWQVAERSWPSRLFWILYGLFFGLWIGHETGWVPGGCVLALLVLFATERKSGWWSRGIRNPLGILEIVIVGIAAVWFVRNDNEWLPFACLIAVALLLSSEKQGRRSIRENLWRLKSAAWVATSGAAFFWFWKEPSFGSVILAVAVVVLWFGSLLLHLSSGERVALSHPQS